MSMSTNTGTEASNVNEVKDVVSATGKLLGVGERLMPLVTAGIVAWQSLRKKEEKPTSINWVQLLTALAVAASAFFGSWYGTPPAQKPTPPIVIPPGPPIQNPPRQAEDNEAAICKLYTPGFVCTCVHVGDFLKTKHSYVVTAAHCINRNGQEVTVGFSCGEKVNGTVIRVNRTTDVAIVRCRYVNCPIAVVSATLPKEGERIYHKSWGVDKPGNREDGIVTHPTFETGMVGMRIYFSSGDSGGPIFSAHTKQIIAVCYGYIRGVACGGSCVSIRESFAKISLTEAEDTE